MDSKQYINTDGWGDEWKYNSSAEIDHVMNRNMSSIADPGTEETLFEIEAKENGLWFGEKT